MLQAAAAPAPVPAGRCRAAGSHSAGCRRHRAWPARRRPRHGSPRPRQPPQRDARGCPDRPLRRRPAAGCWPSGWPPTRWRSY
ncbi:hypothetical protein ABB25_01565 [Stenotrophomonas koreensis]|uniref:Uncharacterized protein n=1 Tax=Stenotrophomonas koreensis TaxID=266128 RepID=A0A0R0C3Y8_9GAMM|nr:hypothetical protein ABB25_01565 [Stenotrophomonas koreensis]